MGWFSWFRLPLRTVKAKQPRKISVKPPARSKPEDRRCFKCGGRAKPSSYRNKANGRAIYICSGCSKTFEVRG